MSNTSEGSYKNSVQNLECWPVGIICCPWADCLYSLYLPMQLSGIDIHSAMHYGPVVSYIHS